MGEIRRRDRAPHTRGSPRDAPVSADGRRGQRRDALPSVTSSLARQAVADQIDAGATKTRQLAGICLSRAGGERFRANAQRRSGMEVVVPSGTDAPVTDDAGDEHQG